MSTIDVARLELVWDNVSNIKPANVPHYSLFRRIKNVKITWFTEYMGEITLKESNVNYMYHKGYYYFLRKREPLDENKKVFNYTIIVDFWMSLLLRKITVKGNLIKTNDEQILWDNLQSTIPMSDNLSGLTRLNVAKGDKTVEEIMDDVEIINCDKTFKAKVITKSAYRDFLDGINQLPQYKVTTANFVGIISKLKLTEIDSWKQILLNDLKNWLKDNKTELVIGGVTNETFSSSAPNVASELKRLRDIKKSSDISGKVIRIESATGILSSTKEDSFVKKIDLSGLTGIRIIPSAVKNFEAKNRLVIELFGKEETKHIPKMCYLRPKLYANPTSKPLFQKTITTLNYAPSIYEGVIHWNDISSLPIQYSEHLEDWSDSKYIKNAISTDIHEKRMGFIPGSFSTTFKEKLFRGLYVKDKINEFSFVNGINLDHIPLRNKRNIDVGKTIKTMLWFTNIGEDLSKKITYNKLQESGDIEIISTSVTKDIKAKHDELTKIKKNMETTFQAPIYTSEYLDPGTLIVNNTSYGFYEFSTKTEGNSVDEFTAPLLEKEVDLDNTIVFITEPGDVKTSTFENIKNNGFGLRYCVKRKYNIEPDKTITKFINDKQINNADVMMFKRLLEKPEVTDKAIIHNNITNFLGEITKVSRAPVVDVTYIEEEIKNQSIETWLNDVWYNKMDYYATAGDWIRYVLRYYWYYKPDKKAPWKSLSKGLYDWWPKTSDGRYVLPIEYRIFQDNLFIKFEKNILVIG